MQRVPKCLIYAQAHVIAVDRDCHNQNNHVDSEDGEQLAMDYDSNNDAQSGSVEHSGEDRTDEDVSSEDSDGGYYPNMSLEEAWDTDEENVVDATLRIANEEVEEEYVCGPQSLASVLESVRHVRESEYSKLQNCFDAIILLN